jgi:hypothetical protein
MHGWQVLCIMSSRIMSSRILVILISATSLRSLVILSSAIHKAQHSAGCHQLWALLPWTSSRCVGGRCRVEFAARPRRSVEFAARPRRSVEFAARPRRSVEFAARPRRSVEFAARPHELAAAGLNRPALACSSLLPAPGRASGTCPRLALRARGARPARGSCACVVDLHTALARVSSPHRGGRAHDSMCGLRDARCRNTRPVGACRLATRNACRAGP